MFNCKPFLLFLVFIAVSFRLSAEQPNILFIFTDDHSHRAVGCYPESPDWVKTPNIDSLADNGIRFANCYMGSWCMGARATLLTGYQTYGIKSMRMEGKYPGSVYDSKKSLSGPPCLERTDTRLPRLGNGIRVRTTDTDETGIFKKFGIAPHSLKILEIILKNNLSKQMERKQ